MPEINIKKNLAGKEDLLFSESSVTQERNGGLFVIHGIRGFWPVNSQEEFDSIDPTQHPKIVLQEGTQLKYFSYVDDAWMAVKAESDAVTGAAKTSSLSFLDGNDIEKDVLTVALTAVSYDRYIVFPVLHFISQAVRSDTIQEQLAQSCIEVTFYKNGVQFWSDSVIYGIGTYSSRPYYSLLSAEEAASYSMTAKWRARLTGETPITTGNPPFVVPQALVVQVIKAAQDIVIA